MISLAGILDCHEYVVADPAILDIRNRHAGLDPLDGECRHHDRDEDQHENGVDYGLVEQADVEAHNRRCKRRCRLRDQ